MKKKISLIIPIYNGERYIARCIESVLTQENFNLEDIELLPLNDGSSDGSLKILKHYQTLHPDSIFVLDQKNMGVAKTRNRGIEIAKATYIMFMDQDDYIDSDYLKTFYDAIEGSGCDVVVGGYKRPNSEGKIIHTVRQKNTEYSKKYRISAAWAKVHRADFLKKNKILFYDNTYGEDIIFTMLENNRTEKITAISYVGYSWFWNEKSVSNTSHRTISDGTRILKLLNDMAALIRTNIDTYYLIQTGIFCLLFSGRNASRTIYLELYRNIFELFAKEGIGLSGGKYLPFGPSGARFSVRIAVFFSIFIHRLNLMGLFASVYCRGKANS